MINKTHNSKPTLTITTIIVTIILLHTNTTRPIRAQQDCKPAFQITGRQPPPGKCNTESDSECCVPGQNYTAYWCSPPVTNRTSAVLNLSGFDKGQDGGGPARCDNKYHSDNTPVVALSTGWYNETSPRCGEVILITGNGGRTARGVVVDECNSYSGCDVNNDYQPPCPYNVVAASKAVWVALGVSENSDMYGEMNITWTPTDERINSGQRNNHKIIIVVVLVVVVLGMLGMVWLLVVCIKKRKRNPNDSDEEQWEDSLVILSEFPKRFTYKELKLSTDNFNEQRKLGSGGFGSVFEGTLNDGVRTQIAVKRLDNVKQGKKEFLTEVKTTGSVHHFNLVKLVGFCAEKGHRLLVYDYMSNGSLEKWIFRDNNKGYYDPLNWATRKKIILHIAKGLSYLHEDCKSKILHLDIKPQNILLDNEFNAKLADFGLAKLIDKEESFAATQMRGTRGYLAPEWLISKKITEKVDVYCCGIVILEVVFQRRNFNVQNQDDPTLVEMVREKLEVDRLYEAIDECCGDDEEMRNNVEEVEKMIKVAIWCIQVDPTRRPSMSTVVKVLEGAIALEPILDVTFGNSTFSETSGDIISSNATFDFSSITFPR